MINTCETTTRNKNYSLDNNLHLTRWFPPPHDNPLTIIFILNPIVILPLFPLYSLLLHMCVYAFSCF